MSPAFVLKRPVLSNFLAQEYIVDEADMLRAPPASLGASR
jgi:hypothetical protein